MKRNIFLIILLFIFANCYSQNFMDEKLFSDSADYDFNALMNKYLENDTQLKRKKMTLESARIEYQQNTMQLEPQIELSTGQINLNFNKDDGTTTSFSPSVSLKVPQWNNLQVNANMPSKIESSGFTVESSSVKVSTDIISSNKIQNDIKKTELERSLFEAEQNYRNQELSAKSDYYSVLINLYEKALSILDEREKYLDKLISFETVKLQGYTESSSKYKIAQLEKENAYNTCLMDYKELKNMFLDFSLKCDTNLDFLISEIPDIELVDFNSFDKSDYSKIEKSLYQKKNNELKLADQRDWSLSSNVNYGYKNNKTLDKDVYSVGVGLDGTYKGIGMGLGVSVPVNQTPYPSINMNFSFNPLDFKNSQLKEKLNNINLELLDFDVQDAYLSYEETQKSYINKAESLEFENTLLKEQNSYYKDLLAQSEKSYKNGIISQSDYIKAENQCLKIKINLIKNILNKYKYNLEVEQMFLENNDE